MDLLELLRGTDLLAGLPDEQLREVLTSMEMRDYQRGAKLFDKGEEGDGVYLVVEGKLRVESDGVPLLVAEAGQWVGEVALLDSGPRSAAAVAETDLKTLKWQRGSFQQMVRRWPEVASGILRILTRKLRASTLNQVDLLLEQERISQDLKRAREIQMGMLPAGDLCTDVIEFSGYCRPAAEVGGDYFDFMTYDEGQLGMIIGDVTGHGFYAGLFVAMAKSCLHTQARLDYSPRAVMPAMGRTLSLSIQRSLLMTSCYVVFDPLHSRLRYCNAGHIYPYHLRHSTGNLEKLEALDPLLGIQDLYGWDFTEKERSWESGDLLVMYSDGVTEARSRDGEMFEHERLEACIRDNADASAPQLKEVIVQALASHCEGSSYDDDVTIVVAGAR